MVTLKDILDLVKEEDRYQLMIIDRSKTVDGFYTSKKIEKMSPEEIDSMKGKPVKRIDAGCFPKTITLEMELP